MVQAPKPNDISNVFAMHQPQHMMAKLVWELETLMKSTSVWTDNKGYAAPIFAAFNTAVTAWHISDWLWQSCAETRAILANRFKLSYSEGTNNQLHVGLKRFQKVIVEENRPLYVCREIANGSKHMRKRNTDANIRAVVDWLPAVESVGLVKAGDLVPSLIIADGLDRRDAVQWFIQAFGFWEQLFVQEKLIPAATRLPDKIKAEQQNS
jgi:hypothetical protein